MLLLSGAMCGCCRLSSQQPQVRRADRSWRGCLAVCCHGRSNHGPSLDVLEAGNPTGSELAILGLARSWPSI